MYEDALSFEYKVKYTWRVSELRHQAPLSLVYLLAGPVGGGGDKVIRCLSSHGGMLLLLWECAGSVLSGQEPFSLVLIIHYTK